MCPRNITAGTDPGSDSATVTFSMRFVDNVDSQPEAYCDHISGSSFAFGETTVVCTVVDFSNNTANCNFNVTVTGNLSSSSSNQYELFNFPRLQPCYVLLLSLSFNVRFLSSDSRL